MAYYSLAARCSAVQYNYMYCLGCAAACLADAACVQFVTEPAAAPAGQFCRLSYTCRIPSGSGGTIFHGYQRNCSAPGCGCVAPPAGGGVVAQVGTHGLVAVPFTIKGDTLTVSCAPGTAQHPVLINGDASSCFLYSSETGLPAPPLSIPCNEEGDFIM